MMLRARPEGRGSPRRCRAACRRPTCDRLRRRRVERQPLSAWSKACASGDPGAAVDRAERQSRHDRVRECAEPVFIPLTRALRPYGCAPALPHGGAPSVMRTAASRTEPRCPNLSDGIVGAGGPVQRTSSSPRRDVRCSAGYHTRALDMDKPRALPAQHRPDPEPTARMLPARCARWMKSLGKRPGRVGRISTTVQDRLDRPPLDPCEARGDTGHSALPSPRPSGVSGGRRARRPNLPALTRIVHAPFGDHRH